MSDRIGGLTNEAVGTVKQRIGRATGNERLEAEGLAQELKGEGQQALGKAKSAVKDGADALRDAAHRNL